MDVVNCSRYTVALQRQANFMLKDVSLLEAQRRLALPPDPSNTRIQGAYADVWQQLPHPFGPARHPARSQSSLEISTPKASLQAAAGVGRQQQMTTLQHRRQVWLNVLIQDYICTSLTCRYLVAQGLPSVSALVVGCMTIAGFYQQQNMHTCDNGLRRKHSSLQRFRIAAIRYIYMRV